MAKFDDCVVADGVVLPHELNGALRTLSAGGTFGILSRDGDKSRMWIAATECGLRLHSDGFSIAPTYRRMWAEMLLAQVKEVFKGCNASSHVEAYRAYQKSLEPMCPDYW